MHMYNRCPNCKKELGVYRYGFSPTFCSERCIKDIEKKVQQSKIDTAKNDEA